MIGHDRNAAQDAAPPAWNARSDESAPPDGVAAIFTFYVCVAILGTLAALVSALSVLIGFGQ